MRSPTVEIRQATVRDAVLLRRAIYAAWRWREAWDEAAFAEYLVDGSPDSYVDDFGRRRGDAGVIAVDGARGRTFLGAAWYRFFTAEAHRVGFLAADVPEAVVAVEAGARGRGVGRQLMESLLSVAEGRGVARVSLHVSRENARAQELYRSLGFTETERGDDRGAVMVRQVPGVPQD